MARVRYTLLDKEGDHKVKYVDDQNAEVTNVDTNGKVKFKGDKTWYTVLDSTWVDDDNNTTVAAP